MENHFLLFWLECVGLVNQVSDNVAREIVRVVKALELYVQLTLLRDESECDRRLSWVTQVKLSELWLMPHKFDSKLLTLENTAATNSSVGSGHA